MRVISFFDFHIVKDQQLNNYMNNGSITEYDLAISFLAEDEPIAIELYNELSPMMNVFVYSEHKEELAGSDGVEVFRSIFKDRTKLIVILYREGWGKSQWTNLEEQAIKEYGLVHRWEGILLIKMDDSKIPSWLPSTYIYLDFNKFTLEEIVGSIKFKTQERGSIFRPNTAIEKAKILENKTKFINQRNQFLNSNDGVNAALEEVTGLFDKIDHICKTIVSEHLINFEYGKVNQYEYILKGFYLSPEEGSKGYSVKIMWIYHASNTLRDSKLLIDKINLGRSINRDEPILEETLEYDFELSPLISVCWRDCQTKKTIDTEKLADEIVQIIINFKMPKTTFKS